MDLDLTDIDGLCARPRCGLPIAGAGEAYGLCARHGHEERNRRLAERDARAKAPTVRPITRGLTTSPDTRPLSAVVGARPTPTPIEPSASTLAAKEPPVPRVFKLRPNADLHPDLCRNDGCTGPPHVRGVCDGCRTAARNVGAYEAIAGPDRRGQKHATVAVAKPPAGKAPLSEAEIATKISDAERRELELGVEPVLALNHDPAAIAMHRANHPDAIHITELPPWPERPKSAALVKENNGLRDALAQSADKLQVVVAVLNLDPTADLAKQARDIAAWMGVATDAANAFGVTSPSELKMAIDDAVADTHLRPPAVKQPAAPALRLFQVQQAGGRSRGVLSGYVEDATGLFRAADGSVFGCLYSCEPVERPALGEPGPDEDVWVRTSIDEVTAAYIHTADGGRYRRSEWGAGRFARPVKAGGAPVNNIDPADDIPF